MKKRNLLGLFLVLTFLTGKNLSAQDVDLTHLIVNNDFEYIAEGVEMTAATWKPKDPGTNQGYTSFYGWICDLDVLASTSQGINKDFTNHSGDYGVWISSTDVFPEFYEFYQLIDKQKLGAGTYKVQCLLSGTKMPTSQRLFANQNVQYFKDEASYPMNQTAGEIATFAGYANPAADKELSEMVVYTTITDKDSLKIGIRTGCIKGDGTRGAKQWGWFKADYFRLTRIDALKAADASLSAITLSVGTIDFSPETFEYNVSLPEGTTVVTPIATATVEDVIIRGGDEVDLTSGSGSSTLLVTALDGSTTKIYTINYTVGNNSGLEDVDMQTVTYNLTDGRLTVQGAESYTVYTTHGGVVAEVKDTTGSVRLAQGVYIVKTNKGKTLKVIVK